MKTCPKIICLSDLTHAPHAREILRQAGEVVCCPPRRQAVESHLATCEAIYASLYLPLDEELFSQAPRLKVIATPSTGRDHIDLAGAAKRHIAVLSLKEERAFLDQITATAEMAWALLLACVRKLPASFDAAKQGRWARDEFRGMQLAGKTLGILGYGRLGTIVAQYACAFRMKVLACDIRTIDVPQVCQVDFDTLLAQSDILSLHVHLDETTRGIIGAAAFAKMKPGAVLVNTSRGAVIDEAALLANLLNGKVAAAGLDVIEGEWREDLIQHPLIQYARTHDNLVITPHLGGVTYDSQRMAFEFTAQKLADFLRNEA